VDGDVGGDIIPQKVRMLSKNSPTLLGIFQSVVLSIVLSMSYSPLLYRQI